MKWWIVVPVLLFAVVLAGSLFVFLGLRSTKTPPPLNTSATIDEFPDYQKLVPPSLDEPQLIQLNAPIKAGQILHIVGEFAQDSVNLLQLDFLVNATLIPLSLSTRPHNFSSSPQVLASIFEVHFPNGTILNDTVPSPLMDSKAFDFRVRFLDQHLQVFANRGEIGIYERLAFFESVKTIRLTGSMRNLSMFRLEGAKYPNPFTSQRITFGNSSRLDITAQPIPNILDQSKMSNYFPSQQWVDMNKESKLSILEGPFNYSMYLYRYFGIHDWSELDPLANKTQVYSLLNNRQKRRSSSSSSRGGSSSRGSGSSGRSSSSSSGGSIGSLFSLVFGALSSRGSHSHGSSSGSVRSWLGSGGSSSSDKHYEEPPWYGRTDRKAYLYGDTKNYSPRNRLGNWRPFPTAATTVGYMYNARTPSYSYRFRGETYFQSTCGDCTYYCDGCCKFCDEPAISFHNKRSGDSADPNTMPLSERFDVTFLGAKDFPTFQISVRFIEGVIVRNTYTRGKWEQEERDGAIPIDGWKIFEMTIVNSNEALTIYFGGRKFTDFRHREASRLLEKVQIDGDLEIHKVFLDGKLIEGA